MTAINLPHYKLKLRDVAEELYREHGWQMPRGFVDSQERDPANFMGRMAASQTRRPRSQCAQGDVPGLLGDV